MSFKYFLLKADRFHLLSSIQTHPLPENLLSGL